MTHPTTEPPPSGPPRLLKVDEVAVYLGVSRATVYRMLGQGAIARTDVARPGSKSTRSRVSESALAAYLARATTPASWARAR
jgi:excisionase family DNA binding protein